MSTLQKETHWDRTLTCYAARPANANDMLARTIALSADNEAVVDGAVRLRYRELAAALAANLSARGVGKGERVAVMLANRVEAVLSVIAIARIGAIVVPIGTRLRRPEITYIFDDAQPIAVIHGEEFAGELPDTGPAHAMRFACGSVAWNALLEAGTPAAPPVDVAEEDVFGILYTSGTTGRPKGAMLTHLNVVHSALHWEDGHRMTRNERTVLCVPWSHVSGLCGVVMPFLRIGGTLVLMAEFKRRDFLVLVQNERITHALLVPAMYGLCLLDRGVVRRRVLEVRRHRRDRCAG